MYPGVLLLRRESFTVKRIGVLDMGKDGAWNIRRSKVTSISFYIQYPGVHGARTMKRELEMMKGTKSQSEIRFQRALAIWRFKSEFDCQLTTTNYVKTYLPDSMKRTPRVDLVAVTQPLGLFLCLFFFHLFVFHHHQVHVSCFTGV
jgi:hypothetical protein